MGKDNGFLLYQRRENGIEDPLRRIKNYQEFHQPLTKEQRRLQGARCMNCGVPFCQSSLFLHGMTTGCPLHNLIPEWNDEIYRGNPAHALARLIKTNPFPEFTSRVCPALCEKACLCGVNGEPVSIRDNEYAVIEDGFALGLMQPRIPQVRSGRRVAVVGSGPSGLAAADRLNQRGHHVEVFERDDKPGGLLMYGIPNMKLDKKVVARRIELMEKEGVIFHTNSDVGRTISAADLQKDFDAVILCCGAKQARSLKLEGSEKTEGILFAVDFLKNATKAVLAEKKDEGAVSAEGKHVVIVGGGDTGNDCVATCLRQNCAGVTQLEMMPCPPEKRAKDNPWPEWPRVLKTDYGQEEAIAVFGHDPRIYQTTVAAIETEKGKLKAVHTVKVHFENGKMVQEEGSEQVLPCELLIIAAGFLGCEAYTSKAFNLELNRGRAVTEKDSYRIKDHLFSAGDMHRGQSLVVWAIEEGRACAREVDEDLMGYTNL
ncbi:MAG: glutamate synthase subunit beta [Erysipelotrichaceae bacterium]|nr:glutamate synthase subunit beta [Erysipelotrichaceae bacterium]MCI1326229.1 glutamate synthase subunit beta [Solobacterium sp.]MCH4044596.1 glutamate synthase subunit beta [Erysipelotrichaceae bacterium]MCH4121808.1 glutamate synthase subunit beta [Erysipelotrichaceae bacterium]MCI1363071.1 glutamate synthase subunit beta [Solobacterium sp.]